MTRVRYDIRKSVYSIEVHISSDLWVIDTKEHSDGTFRLVTTYADEVMNWLELHNFSPDSLFVENCYKESFGISDGGVIDFRNRILYFHPSRESDARLFQIRFG